VVYPLARFRWPKYSVFVTWRDSAGVDRAASAAAPIWTHTENRCLRSAGKIPDRSVPTACIVPADPVSENRYSIFLVRRHQGENESGRIIAITCPRPRYWLSALIGLYLAASSWPRFGFRLRHGFSFYLSAACADRPVSELFWRLLKRRTATSPRADFGPCPVSVSPTPPGWFYDCWRGYSMIC